MSDMNNQTVEQPVNFDAIKIGLASPELIRQWSHGEVKKPDRISCVKLSCPAYRVWFICAFGCCSMLVA